MNGVQTHIVRREVVNVTVVGTESDGLALQRKVGDLCRNWLTPALEEIFASAVPGGEHWILERLEVDAGWFTLENFERGFVSSVADAVARKIRDLSPDRTSMPEDAKSSGSVRRLTDVQSVREAFLHFLATGALPWWFHLPAGQTLEQAMTTSWREVGSPAAAAPGLTDVLASPAARLRLVRQFSNSFLEGLLQSISQPAIQAVREAVSEMERQEIAQETLQRLSERLWQAAFAVLAERRPVTLASLIQEWTRAATADESVVERRVLAGIARAWPSPANFSAVSPEGRAALRPVGPLEASVPDTDNGSAARLDLDEGVMVECGGVVLLHPFLQILFERLHVAAEGRLLQPDRALALVHFLATGAKRAPEYALILPKLLCGLALEHPVGAPVELTVDEATEADSLLRAVIGHWSALGDTSPDALRGTFLTRPGKLSRRGDDHLLQVETHAVDVLLDSLPWGIGAIRLPWMTTLLWVEWRM